MLDRLFKSEPPSLVQPDPGSYRKIRAVIQRVVQAVDLRTVGADHPERLHSVCEGMLAVAIEEFAKAIKSDPGDWVYYYMAAEYCNRARHHAAAFYLLKRGESIRPEDPRITNALGTTLWALTRARYCHLPRDARCTLASLLSSMPYPTSPERAKRELDKMGITVEDAACSAAAYFMGTLALGVREAEKSIILDSLKSLEHEFAFRYEGGRLICRSGAV